MRHLNRYEKVLFTVLGISIGLLVLIGCASALGGGSKKVEVAVIEQATDPVPSLGISFAPVPNYATSGEKTKIKNASKKVNEVIQSQCFKDFMLNRKLIQTNGKSNQEVILDLLAWSGEIPVSMYYRCMKSWRCPFGTSAVAYRQPPEKTINLNRAVFHSGLSDCEWASTMAHEGSHVRGYGHDFNWNKERDYSVPYSINAAFSKCCR